MFKNEFIQWLITGIVGNFGWFVFIIFIANIRKVYKFIGGRYRKLIKPLLETYSKSTPLDIIPLEAIKLEAEWIDDFEDIIAKDIEDVYEYINKWMQCKTGKGLIIAGDWGSGKTYLCRFVVGKLANSYLRFLRWHFKMVPIMIPIIESLNISAEIMSALQREEIEGISLKDLRYLSRKNKLLLIFDGTDQASYVSGEANIFTKLQEYTRKLEGGKIIFVVRTEFIKRSIEIREFAKELNLDIIYLKPFNDEKMKEYLYNKGLKKLFEIIQNNNELKLLCKKPIILKNISEIDVNRIEEVITRVNINISKIYEKCIIEEYKEFSEDYAKSLKNLLSECSFRMYTVESMYSTSNSRQIIEKDQVVSIIKDVFDDEKVNFEKILKDATFLSIFDRIRERYQFEHASFMEYFVANKIIVDIRNKNESSLSKKIIHYMVSEFIAGLLTHEDTIILFNILTSTISNITKNNIIDILAETEGSIRQEAGKIIEALSEKIDWANLNNDYWDSYLIFLALAAGAFSIKFPVEALLNYIRSEDINDFLSNKLFITKNNYEYYGYNQDVLINEWLEVLKNKEKWSHLRSVFCYIVGEKRVTAAYKILSSIVNDPEEILEVRKHAKEALDKIAVSTNTE
ncbi:MAG: NACHT domain-containing protein [Candidatus Aminicenantes bacterium]|nr:NACHT domain-containing protein [Candidatus Aminicenantes bacterium]